MQNEQSIAAMRQSQRYSFGANSWLFFLCVAALASVIGQSLAAAQTPVRRTKAQVEALISRAGGATPEWWPSTRLTYSDTLDLNWPLKPVGEWNARRNVGQYIWDIINPNEHRWREGIKLVHHLMIRHKSDRAKLVRSMQMLGSMFYNLMEDWPRAAFWWQTCIKYGGRADPIRLAHCYWKMGSKEMATEILSQYREDPTRHGALIKLWADMGQFERAIRLAELKARRGMPVIGYLTAGDACRLAGRYKDAVAYYEKALAANTRGRSENDFKKDKERTRASIEAIKLFEMLNLRRIGDGAYTGDSIAFAGQLHVEVRVKGGRIESVRVTKHREKQFYSALTETPEQIVEKQGVKGVDAVTGATMTSEAIINATAKALSSGMR